MSPKKLTKRQAFNFARIQSGLLLLNGSSTEFEDTEINGTDSEDRCRYFMLSMVQKFKLSDDEKCLGHTQGIIDYVRRTYDAEKLPPGVVRYYNKYRSFTHEGRRQIYLGLHDTIEDALQAQVEHKSGPIEC